MSLNGGGKKREKAKAPSDVKKPSKTSGPSKQNNEKPRHEQPGKELEKRIKDLEGKIVTLEEEVAKLENELSKPEVYSDTEKSSKLNNKYESKKSELNKINQEWEKLVDSV